MAVWGGRADSYAKSARNLIPPFHRARATGRRWRRKKGRFCAGTGDWGRGGWRAAGELVGTLEEAKRKGSITHIRPTLPYLTLLYLFCPGTPWNTLESPGTSSSELLNVIKSSLCRTARRAAPPRFVRLLQPFRPHSTSFIQSARSLALDRSSPLTRSRFIAVKRRSRRPNVPFPPLNTRPLFTSAQLFSNVRVSAGKRVAESRGSPAEKERQAGSPSLETGTPSHWLLR